MHIAGQLAVAILFSLVLLHMTGVQEPLAGAGTLTLVDDDRIEIRYRTHEETLPPATFVQTLAAVAIAANIPPSPLNPWLVDNALHTLGIPHKDYRSCWPDDGAILLVPTAPAGAVDTAMSAAGPYYDPVRHARDFEAAYWNRLFVYRSTHAPAAPGWPGDPVMESLKESIVGSLPFPANLGSLDVYAKRGIVPLFQLRGGYAPVCFLFVCFWFPKCRVEFVPTAEGYGIPGIQ